MNEDTFKYEKEYDDFLDSVYPSLKINDGLIFYPSEILKTLAPIAYEVGYRDFFEIEELDED